MEKRKKLWHVFFGKNLYSHVITKLFCLQHSWASLQTVDIVNRSRVREVIKTRNNFPVKKSEKQNGKSHF